MKKALILYVNMPRFVEDTHENHLRVFRLLKEAIGDCELDVQYSTYEFRHTVYTEEQEEEKYIFQGDGVVDNYIYDFVTEEEQDQIVESIYALLKPDALTKSEILGFFIQVINRHLAVSKIKKEYDYVLIMRTDILFQDTELEITRWFKSIPELMDGRLNGNIMVNSMEFRHNFPDAVTSWHIEDRFHLSDSETLKLMYKDDVKQVACYINDQYLIFSAKGELKAYRALLVNQHNNMYMYVMNSDYHFYNEKAITLKPILDLMPPNCIIRTTRSTRLINVSIDDVIRQEKEHRQYRTTRIPYNVRTIGEDDK